MSNFNYTKGTLLIHQRNDKSAFRILKVIETNPCIVRELAINGIKYIEGSPRVYRLERLNLDYWTIKETTLMKAFREVL